MSLHNRPEDYETYNPPSKKLQEIRRWIDGHYKKYEKSVYKKKRTKKDQEIIDTMHKKLREYMVTL